jgi:hypothetical protein
MCEQAEYGIITEKVYEFQEDIDNIYKGVIQNIVKEIFTCFKEARTTDRMREFMSSDDIFLKRVRSEEFKSDDAKEAHESNPIILYINKDSGNSYSPKRQEIKIGLRTDIIRIFMKHNWDKKAIVSYANGDHNILREYSAKKIKGTINHELSHWARDSKTGHINDTLNKASKGGDVKHGKLLDLGTDYEIDAQIHNIQVFYKSINPKRYNKLTMLDLIRQLPTLNMVRNKYRNLYVDTMKFKGRKRIKDEWIEWQRSILRRLHRENLIGKNMTSFAGLTN